MFSIMAQPKGPCGGTFVVPAMLYAPLDWLDIAWSDVSSLRRIDYRDAICEAALRPSMALILRRFEQLLGHRDVDDVRDKTAARLIADLRDQTPALSTKPSGCSRLARISTAWRKIPDTSWQV